MADAYIWSNAAASIAGLTAAMLAPTATHAQARIVVPAQPLSQALLVLARATGRNILFAPESVAGLVSAPVNAGDFDEALRQMLSGLPVRVVRQREGVSVARAARLPAAPPKRRATGARTPVPPPPSPPPAIIYVIASRPGIRPAALTDGDAVPFPDLLTATQVQPSDRNLAEALARMPGVLMLTTNLQGDLGGVDRAARAEGQFVALRGLPGAYSVVTIDGVRMPQAMPYGRDAQLGLLPNVGFSNVQVIKTPGPELAGDATAAVVDVQSPSGFTGAPSELQLSVATGVDGSALAYRQDAGYGQIALAYKRRFGDDRWAIAISGQFSRRAFANSQQTYQQGSLEFRVTDAAGRSPAGVNPADNLQLTSVNAQFTRGETRTGSGMGALEFRPDATTRLYARLSVTASATDQEIAQLGFQGTSDGAGITRTAIDGGLYRLTATAGAIHYWFQTNPERSHFALGQIGGSSWLGALELRVRLYAGRGVTSRPNHIETSFWDNSATALSSGVNLAYRDGYPVPQLSTADRALADSVESFPVHRQGEKRDQYSRDDVYGGEWSVGRTLDSGIVRRIDGGASLTRSHRSGWLVDTDYTGLLPAGTSLASSGLVSGSIQAILPGIYDFRLPLLNAALLSARIAAATATALSADARNGSTSDATETVLAGFVRARLVLGQFLLTPGLRAEHAQVDTLYWVSGNNGVDADGIDYGWNRSRSSFAALLPSVSLRWDPGNGPRLRAALWSSYTRPSTTQLAGAAAVTTSSTGAVQISRGNPNLKAVRALNLDLDGSWTGRDGTGLSVALFAKRLSHYIYDAGGDFSNSQSSTASDAGVVTTEPRNGGTARLYGVELSGHVALRRFAAALAGWSLSAQATFLHGRVRLHNPDLDAVEHLQYAPDYNVSAELGYRRRRWSGSLVARWTGAYVQQYGLLGTSASGYSVLNSSALDTWVRPARQIDANLALALDAATNVQLFARNLLSDLAYRSTIGRYSDTAPQTIATGRFTGLRVQHRF